MARKLTCAAFEKFIIEQEPYYDRELLKDIRPYEAHKKIARMKSRWENHGEHNEQTEHEERTYGARIISGNWTPKFRKWFQNQCKRVVEFHETGGDLIGFYTVQPYDAYPKNSHTFEKMREVYSDTTLASKS